MKRNVKKVLALLLALVLVLALAACGKTTTDDSNKNSNGQQDGSGGQDASSNDRVLPGGLVVPEGKTTSITIQAEMDVGTLNPWTGQNSAVTLVSLNIHERLFEYVEDGTIQPFLVKDYEWISDTVLECTIYDNIFDSEGNHFTTSDILFCFNQAKDSAAVGAKTNAFDYDNIKIVDEYTIDIAFKTGNILVYDNLASINMVTQAAFEASGDNMEKNVVGLGTYVVESYTAGTELTLAVNENYWMTDENVADGAIRYNQNVDKIKVKIIPDETQRTVEFDAGTIDAMFYCPTSALSMYQNDDSCVAFYTNTSITRMLYFNSTANSVMQNADLRRAVAYAINTEEVNIGAFDGMFTAATQLACPMTAEYDPNIEQYPYDLDKAAEHLAAAGYKAGELTLHCIYSSGHGLVAQIIQDQLSAVGITVELEEVDASNITSIINTGADGWDMCVNQNAQNAGTILFYFYNLLNANGTVRGGWKNEEYQRYFEDALKNGDPVLTEKAYDIVVDECANYALAYTAAWHVNKVGIENPTVANSCPLCGNWEYTADATWLIDD
ncbi:MAG: ABC transporter substrate-binding protein [Oscillospiraceae bacterium]